MLFKVTQCILNLLLTLQMKANTLIRCRQRSFFNHESEEIIVFYWSYLELWQAKILTVPQVCAIPSECLPRSLSGCWSLNPWGKKMGKAMHKFLITERSFTNRTHVIVRGNWWAKRRKMGTPKGDESHAGHWKQWYAKATWLLLVSPWEDSGQWLVSDLHTQTPRWLI